MATNNPLFVPVVVDALMINQNVLSNMGTNIERWQYMYSQFPGFATPQPAPFNYNANLTSTGVILHWKLPQIMRNGNQNPTTGAMDYPLVPNRWLVIRYSGPATARQAVAWVVQSDALGNSTPITGGAPYIQPGSTLQATHIGQVVSLSNWNEPNPQLFLTAIAPGNNMFASYQPYCQSVFSIYDPLTGIATQDNLSYMVAGWYSDSNEDITGSWQTDNISFDAFLEQAGWQITNQQGDTATYAIYHSMVWGLQWNMNGPAPNNSPTPANLKVAVGNTTVDALTAMIKAQAAAAKSEVNAELLEALQYGLVNQFDQQDPEFELKQSIEQAWFGQQNGGYSWEIVDVPVDPTAGDPPPPVSEQELAKEEVWLAALNQNQITYDQNVAQLAQLQWNLYQTWWKYNYYLQNPSASGWPQGTTQQQFEDALNPALTTSLVYQVNALQAVIAQMASSNEVPVGVTQDILQAQIDAYAATQQLPATRQLKQFANRPFSKANDPVVLVQGLGVDDQLSPSLPLACRFMSSLVTGFNYNSSPITVSQVASVIPTPANMSAVPSQMINLMQEFFMLDPTNATMIAKTALGSTDPTVIQNVATAMTGGKNVIGVAPDLNLNAWTQPWSPLVMMWDIVYYPIPHDYAGTNLWSFDGNDYTWNGNNMPNPIPQPLEFMGSIFMTPQASFNFRAQMEKYIYDNPDATNVIALNDFIESTDGWDFLSQSFAGLTQNLTLRDPMPNMSPTFETTNYYPNTTLTDLVGNNATYVPQPGPMQPQPFTPWPASNFQPWRAGQFYIKQLVIADRFGQLCEIVTNQTQTQLAPYLADSITPQFPVIPQEPYRFIQLPPRLLQPARLNLDFVSAANDNQPIGTNPGTNPVCAWLLHNFLDESIVTYDNGGNILGAVWITTNEQAVQVVSWVQAPESNYPSIASLLNNPDLAHLGQMLTSIQTLGPAAFYSFIETLDDAVWTIDSNATTSDQGMILLAGKPVALVRMSLNFDLNGQPLTDPSWRFTFAPSPSPITGYDFNIRLGEAGRQQDGLIGYFVGSNYNQLYTPHVPENVPDPDYVLDVATGDSVSLSFSAGSTAYLSVLMDPRSVVHATTGILPIISISIPQGFVAAAFSNMEITFNIGPLMTDTVQPKDENNVNETPAFTMPIPSLRNGTWDWQQYDFDYTKQPPADGKWNTYPIAPVNPNANFNAINPVIREGLLRLTGAESGGS